MDDKLNIEAGKYYLMASGESVFVEYVHSHPDVAWPVRGRFKEGGEGGWKIDGSSELKAILIRDPHRIIAPYPDDDLARIKHGRKIIAYLGNVTASHKEG
jgi:hypothetical protein